MVSFLIACFLLVFFYRCKIPGFDNDTYKVQSYEHEELINVTIPGSRKHKYDQCHIYIGTNGNSSREMFECSEWVYDDSLYKHTFTKQVQQYFINPFMPNGLFYLNSLDRSISYIRGLWLVFFIIFIFCRNV